MGAWVRKYRVDAKDACHLVPFCLLVRPPSKTLAEGPRQSILPLNGLGIRVGTAGQTAGEGVSAFFDRIPAVFRAGDEFGDWDGVRRI